MHKFAWEIADALKAQPETELRDNIIENFKREGNGSIYIISQKSYNDLISSIGKEPIQFKNNQAALYTSI